MNFQYYCGQSSVEINSEKQLKEVYRSVGELQEFYYSSTMVSDMKAREAYPLINLQISFQSSNIRIHESSSLLQITRLSVCAFNLKEGYYGNFLAARLPKSRFTSHKKETYHYFDLFFRYLSPTRFIYSSFESSTLLITYLPELKRIQENPRTQVYQMPLNSSLPSSAELCKALFTVSSNSKQAFSKRTL